MCKLFDSGASLQVQFEGSEVLCICDVCFQGELSFDVVDEVMWVLIFVLIVAPEELCSFSHGFVIIIIGCRSRGWCRWKGLGADWDWAGWGWGN